jgi:N-acetylglucosamine kinase-like BadF-type ATPase
MAYVIGIDGGGTKTVAAVADSTGRIVGVGPAGPSNYLAVGLEEAKRNIAEAVKSALAAGGMGERRVDVLSAGLAGVGRESGRVAMLAAIESLDLSEKVLLDHDAAIALAGATGGEPGVIVIAGTGSIAFGMNSRGERARAGGLGHVLGDEGSAYWIGLRALSEAVRFLDSRGPETALAAKLMARLGVSDLPSLVQRVYEKHADKSGIAAFAELATEAAQAGDSIAQSILAEAGRELALAANVVIARLGLANQTFHLAYSGGVFKSGEWVLRPFRECVLAAAPAVRLGAPRYTPVIGGVMLGLNALGTKLTEEVLGRLGEMGRFR